MNLFSKKPKIEQELSDLISEMVKLRQEFSLLHSEFLSLKNREISFVSYDKTQTFTTSPMPFIERRKTPRDSPIYHTTSH